MVVEHLMYCVFSKEAIREMNGNRGKLAAMAGHAFLHSWWEAESLCPPTKEIADRYRYFSLAKKIVLVCDETKHLYWLSTKYKGISSLVTDSAITVFENPTTCCIGIGPIARDMVCEDLKSLKVLI